MESQQNTQKEEEVRSDCIKEEFYKWFESRGLLSEMRAYMRQLMVRALEESGKNGNSGMARRAATSPKLQAINLLLVDYLFHEDYLYTVSVFASEAHILESLPQYSRYVSETVRQHRWDRSCLPRFSRQETEDILDTLRLPPSPRDMQQAIQLYMEGQESLLTCVARTLASSHTVSSESNYTLVREVSCPAMLQQDGGPQLWSDEMQNLLLMAGIKLQHIKRLQRKWQQVIEEKKQEAREEVEKEWGVREENLREVVGEERSQLEQQQAQLNNLAVHLAQVHEDVSSRMAELQENRQELEAREDQHRKERHYLEQRLSDILQREKQLELTEAELAKQAEELSIAQAKSSVQVVNKLPATSDISVQVSEPVPDPGPQVPVAVAVAFTNTQTADTADNQQQTSLSPEPDSLQALLLQEFHTERERINELQEENIELRAHVLQLRQRIDEVTNRAAGLSNQLQESQVALALLSGRQEPPPPHLPPALPVTMPGPFFAPTFGYNSSQQQGAGEESLFNLRRQQSPPQHDGRRRPTRYAFSGNPKPTSEESSPTDEVIQSARARIHQLEAESASVQRNFQLFQSRLMSSDSMMFPPLGTPRRTANPLVRLITNEVTSFVPFSNNPLSSQNYYRRPPRPPQSPDEDEDSSSDQATLYNQIRNDSITNARRLFTQRNMRHFERWKQFKKKFRRHQEINQNCRRNITSSDDDEENCGTPRRRYESFKAKEGKKRLTVSFKERNQEVFCGTSDVHTNNQSIDNERRNHQMLQRNESVAELNSLPNLTQNVKTSNNNDKTSNNNDKSSNNNEKIVTLREKVTKETLRSEEEQSMKLIESVKVLLEAQNLMNPVASSTNGSSALESLPRDSDEQPQVEVAINCAVVVEERDNKGSNVNNNDQYKVTENNVSPSMNEVPRKQDEQLNKDIESGRNEEAYQNIVSLSAPSVNPSGPSQGDGEENRLLPASIIARGVEDQDSVTSASDILRELRDTSDSVLSIGPVEANQSNFSDFWD